MITSDILIVKLAVLTVLTKVIRCDYILQGCAREDVKRHAFTDSLRRFNATVPAARAP